MIKRPLCLACLIFLIIQAARVCVFQCAEGQKPSALETAVLQTASVTLAGTVYKVEEKSKVTAVWLKDCAVLASGQVISESKILVYIRHDQQEEKNKKENEKTEVKKGRTFRPVSRSGDIKIGNRVSVQGEAKCFEAARNPGNFDQRAYYQRQGVHVLVWSENLEIRSGKTDKIRQALSRLRSAWAELLKEQLGDYYGGTMSAVLLGDKSGLDAEMKKLYQKNGIGHLLAISGLHMSFIGIGLYGLLRKAGVRFAPAGTAGAAVLILYTLMVGAGVSSLRALIMFLVRIGADITGRDYDLPTALALSAAILCGYQPLYMTDAGFLLSFGALLGIAVLAPLFEEMFGGSRECGAGQPGKKKEMLKRADQDLRRKIQERVRGLRQGIFAGLGVSLAVNLMLLGPMLYFYFEIPPYSVVLNLFVIPAMPLVMGAGLLGSAVSVILPPAGGLILKVSSMILWLYDRLCGAAVTLPGSRIITGKPDMVWIAVYYALLTGICLVFYRLKEKRGQGKEGQKGENGLPLCEGGLHLPGAVATVLAAVMVCACKYGYSAQGGVQVTMLDVGQGDGIFIRGASGERCFVDGGSTDVSSVGAYRIEPYLLANAVSSLDYVFITHGDDDHIGGIGEMLKDQELGVGVETLVLPPEEYLDEKLFALAETAKENGTRVAVIEAGQQLAAGRHTTEGQQASAEAGGMTVTCLGPEPGAGMETGNEASMILQLKYGEFDMLLTGDVEGKGEESLISSGRLEQCDVLKAAHHGSKNSGTEEFLAITKPTVALVSAGVDNRYGHPHEETLERLEEIGSIVYSTQEYGAVTIKSDGKSMQAEGFLKKEDK